MSQSGHRRGRGRVVNHHHIQIGAIVHAAASQTAQAEDCQTRFARQLFKAPAEFTPRNLQRHINCRYCQISQQTIHVRKRQLTRRIGRANLNQQSRPLASQSVQFRAEALLMYDTCAKFIEVIARVGHPRICSHGMDQARPAGDHFAEELGRATQSHQRINLLLSNSLRLACFVERSGHARRE